MHNYSSEKIHSISQRMEPMQRAIKELQPAVWISGIRRSHSDTSQNRAALEAQGQVLKLYAIIDWTDEQVETYLTEHNLPRHPLEADGYASVGDWHSTTKLESGMRPQETRFGGLKRECGLHDNSRWKGSR